MWILFGMMLCAAIVVDAISWLLCLIFSIAFTIPTIIAFWFVIIVIAFVVEGIIGNKKKKD